jgi:hypothetical protein
LTAQLRNLQVQTLSLFRVAQYDFWFVASIERSGNNKITFSNESTGSDSRAALRNCC